MKMKLANKAQLVTDYIEFAMQCVSPARLGVTGVPRAPGEKGVMRLIEHLRDRTDFFDAPASTKKRFHMACEHGLAMHCWNVINLMQRFLDATLSDFSRADCYWAAPPDMASMDLQRLKESAFIVGLCHDLNKTTVWGERMYVENMLKNGRSEAEPWKKTDRRVKLGSTDQVLLAAEFIDLKPDEVQAIRYIEGVYDRSFLQDVDASFEMLTLAAHHADIMASHVVEAVDPWTRSHLTWGYHLSSAGVPAGAQGDDIF